MFQSRRERDIHWACPNLVDERAAAHREIEARADIFALRLLSALAEGRSYSKYEVGAGWYFSVLLEQNLIDALGRIENLKSKPHLKSFLEQRYGSQFQALLTKRQQDERSSRGVIAAFYPRSHPETLARLMPAMDPDPSTAYLMNAWADRMNRECASLRPR